MGQRLELILLLNGKRVARGRRAAGTGCTEGNAECGEVSTHRVPGLGPGHHQRWAGATHPQEAVQFTHGHLLGSVHSLEHLLLVLGGREEVGAEPQAVQSNLSVCPFICLCVSLHVGQRPVLPLSSTLF